MIAGSEWTSLDEVPFGAALAIANWYFDNCGRLIR